MVENSCVQVLESFRPGALSFNKVIRKFKWGEIASVDAVKEIEPIIKLGTIKKTGKANQKPEKQS